MSAVPKLRFREFDGEWLETNIGSCGNFYYGKSAPKWSVSEDAPTPCIRYGELYTKFGATVDKIYSRTNIDPAKLRFSKGGEVLVPRVGEDPRDFAKCTMLPFSGVAIGEMISVFETDQNSLFFTYYFNTMKNQFAKMVAGGNPSNLYYENLKPLAIWRPSLPEQQKIASFLSAVDKKIDLLRQKKDGLELYKKGLMQKIFSQEIRFKQDDGSDFLDWEEVNVENIGKIIGGGTPDSGVAEYWNGDINWFTPTEIKQKYVSESLRKITRDGLKGSSAKLLPKYAILFTSRANIGDVAILKKESATNQGFQSIVVHANHSHDFVYYLLLNSKNIFLKKASGSTFLEISKNEITKISLMVPSLGEQQKIAAVLTAMDTKIQNTSSQIEQMETFKKGLLQQMFV